MQPCQPCVDASVLKYTDSLQLFAMILDSEGDYKKVYTFYKEARKIDPWNRYIEWKERKLRQDLGMEEEKRE